MTNSTPREITLSAGTFDRLHTFRVEGVRGRCSLHSGYEKEGDGILWIMQHAGCIAAHYGADEIAERERLATEAPIANGEIVIVGDAAYRVKVIGNYSNAAVLEPVPYELPQQYRVRVRFYGVDPARNNGDETFTADIYRAPIDRATEWANSLRQHVAAGGAPADVMVVPV